MIIHEINRFPAHIPEMPEITTASKVLLNLGGINNAANIKYTSEQFASELVTDHLYLDPGAQYAHPSSPLRYVACLAKFRTSAPRFINIQHDA